MTIEQWLLVIDIVLAVGFAWIFDKTLKLMKIQTVFMHMYAKKYGKKIDKDIYAVKVEKEQKNED